MLTDKFRQEIEEILSKFPPEEKRAAVLPLIYLAQRENGYVTKQAVNEIAEILEIDPTQVGGLLGFYTLFHEDPDGVFKIQICTDLPCALRGAEDFAAHVCENLGVQFGEATDDGMILVEEVKCLAACDKAPMFQVQEPAGIHYFENQNVESAMELIGELRKKRKYG